MELWYKAHNLRGDLYKTVYLTSVMLSVSECLCETNWERWALCTWSGPILSPILSCLLMLSLRHWYTLLFCSAEKASKLNRHSALYMQKKRDRERKVNRERNASLSFSRRAANMCFIVRVYYVCPSTAQALKGNLCLTPCTEKEVREQKQGTERGSEGEKRWEKAKKKCRVCMCVWEGERGVVREMGRWPCV